eukprot:TRINITY_DN53525_c0_g1_i1.p1 TRINITY_DN53525_c0_g1~~TRINITY_DN53525_c0_g1_i1.p1  ORF type:complete len:232 (-),score=111.18 TRINITY_DN53525_c0_g1_i1:110-805(-)
MSKSATSLIEKESRIDAEGNVKASDKGVIVVLVGASLETVKTKKGYELLTADTHGSILKKFKKDPKDYRPDILHQCLLTCLDSPLNKAGLLKIYIHTRRNVLIDVNPQLRIPRTFKRFCGLMVQLLHKQKIRASNSTQVLLKCIKNPVTQYFPAGCSKIGMSVTGELVDVRDWVHTLPENEKVVFAVGAQAHGVAPADFVEKFISISQYPLSGSVALSRLLYAFEGKFSIL